MDESVKDKRLETAGQPFIDYYYEDKSKYKTATEAGYIDPDNDFLIGESGGFLMNINFKFVNTHLLREASTHYNKYGEYTSAKGSVLTEYRTREEYRRKNGYTAYCKLDRKTGKILPLRITGAHYNFLNYSQILMLDESSIKIGLNGRATGIKKRQFPKFFESQYWYFKCIEFAINNGFDIILCKTRRAGFSYMESTDTANEMNLNPGRIYIHCAIDNKQLTQDGGLTSFTYDNLLFYEHNTPFKRGFISRAIANLKLGYQNTKREQLGWKTSLLSLSTNNNPSAAVGKDAGIIKCEELSEFHNWNEFYDVTEPTTRTGAIRTGYIRGWGTGGAKGGKWFVFEQNFYSPNSINAMPFENVWDKDSRHELCGFFKPYIWCLQGYIRDDGEHVKDSVDKDGNAIFDAAVEISNKERADKYKSKKTESDYIIYCGQYANCPSESFNSVSSNLFSDILLDEWIERLKHDTSLKFYQDGMLFNTNGKVEFRTNEYIKNHGGKYNKDYYDYIINVPRRGHEHPHGCIRRYIPPQKDAEGKIPKGLYSATYDPVGIDKVNKEITLRHSHNSISVWMNPHPINNFKGALVCRYYGRPETLERADEIFRDLCIYYNIEGEGLVEVNRGETVSNFKKWGVTKYLQKEPVSVWDKKDDILETNSFGVVITDGEKKLTALRLFKEHLYTKIGVRDDNSDLLTLHTIWDLPLCLELKKWASEGNFDRVSEVILRGLQVKHKDIRGNREMSHRRSLLTSDREHILNRNWY